MKLESLKKYQIEPIEQMSCIKGGQCTPSGAGSRIGMDGQRMNYSADATVTDDTTGAITGQGYFTYATDGAANFEACAQMQK